MSVEQALCRAKLEHLLTEIKQSIAEKKHLSAEIQRLIHELEQLRHAGQEELVSSIALQLETSLEQPSALRQTNASTDGGANAKLRGDKN